MKNEDEVSSGNWCHLWRDSQGGGRAVPTVCPCLGTGLWCVQSSEIILNIQIAGGQTQRKGREELYKSDGDHRMGGLAG